MNETRKNRDTSAKPPKLEKPAKQDELWLLIDELTPSIKDDLARAELEEALKWLNVQIPSTLLPYLITKKEAEYIELWCERVEKAITDHKTEISEQIQTAVKGYLANIRKKIADQYQ